MTRRWLGAVTRAPSLALALGVASGAGGCASAPLALAPAVVPAAIEPTDAAERIVLAPAHLRVEADVSAATAHTVRFKSSTGELLLSPSRLEASRMEVRIDVREAEATFQIVADLARGAFLHVDKFPSARFSSRSLRQEADGLRLYGDLELHGTTKSLSVPVTIELDACHVVVRSEFALDRREFGIVSDGTLDDIVSDEVVLRIVADAPRPSRPAGCEAD